MASVTLGDFYLRGVCKLILGQPGGDVAQSQYFGGFFAFLNLFAEVIQDGICRAVSELIRNDLIRTFLFLVYPKQHILVTRMESSPWPVWLRRLACCPVHQKVAGSVPGQGAYPGDRSNLQCGHVWKATDRRFFLFKINFKNQLKK